MRTDNRDYPWITKAPKDDWERLQKAAYIVRLLFGDDSIEPKIESLAEALHNANISQAEYDALSLDEKFILVEEMANINQPASESENLIAAIDIVFEQQYEWLQGTVEDLTLAQALIALETAIDSKTIWKKM